MRKLLPVLLIFGLWGGVMLCPTAQADQKKAAEQKGQPTNAAAASGKTQAYLGLGIEPLHRALVSHLLELIGEGRGVLVAEVADGSPAEKTGLKQDDILVSYDDQKLYSPEQLVKLVQNDKPGREVTLSVVHAGKSEKVKVTLGEHQVAVAARPHRALRLPLPDRGLRPLTAEEQEARWRTFDAMTLTRIDEDHFKAEIKYRDDKGKVDTRTFQGTREELRKDINAEKDLPSNERDHLLRALDLGRRTFEFDFPGIQFTPEGGVIWDFDKSDR